MSMFYCDGCQMNKDSDVVGMHMFGEKSYCEDCEKKPTSQVKPSDKKLRDTVDHIFDEIRAIQVWMNVHESALRSINDRLEDYRRWSEEAFKLQEELLLKQLKGGRASK